MNESRPSDSHERKLIPDPENGTDTSREDASGRGTRSIFRLAISDFIGGRASREESGGCDGHTTRLVKPRVGGRGWKPVAHALGRQGDWGVASRSHRAIHRDGFDAQKRPTVSCLSNQLSSIVDASPATPAQEGSREIRTDGRSKYVIPTGDGYMGVWKVHDHHQLRVAVGVYEGLPWKDETEVWIVETEHGVALVDEYPDDSIGTAPVYQYGAGVAVRIPPNVIRRGY